VQKHFRLVTSAATALAMHLELTLGELTHSQFNGLTVQHFSVCFAA